MKSINLEGGFYFVEGEIFQIIREMTEMTGKNCQITKRGGWNKHGGWNIFMKSINLEGGFFFVEGGIFWKKLVHNSNKRGVEGGKI